MMTGKELIYYILSNNLENEEVNFSEGFLNLMTEEEAAVKYNVGTATIRTWLALDMIKGVKVGNKYYIVPEPTL